MSRYLRMTWAVACFSFRVRASLADAIELHALCALALLRAESPTFKMCMGQARAKARRMCVHTRRTAPRDWYVPPPPPRVA